MTATITTDEQLAESCDKIVIALKNSGINFLAIDFDVILYIDSYI